MVKTITEMIDDIIRREGEYVDHPADRGGPTKYGITLATLKTYRGKNGSGKSHLQALTVEQARAIYESEYYYEPGISRLPESIQPFVFDAAVNHGPKRAIEIVQCTCADAGYDPGPLDGIVGPRTIAAAHRYVRTFLDHLIAMREGYYREIVASDPSQQVFHKGWLNRLDEFREKS